VKHFKARGYKTGDLFGIFHLPNVKTRHDDNHLQAENNFDEMLQTFDVSKRRRRVSSFA